MPYNGARAFFAIVGRGVFCPEGRAPDVDRVVGTIALSRQGIDFGVRTGGMWILSSFCWGLGSLTAHRCNPMISTFLGWQALAR